MAGRLVPRGRFARSVIVLAGGTAASQVIFALASPALTRLYPPEDFGLLGVYGSAITLLGVVVSLRYTEAIPLPSNEVEATNVVALSLVLGAAMSCLFGALGIGFAHPFTHLLGVPRLASYMWLLPLSLLGNCLYRTLYLWTIREKGFSVMARTRVAQASARVGVQLALGIGRVAPLGLLLGDLAGGATGSGSFIRLLRRRRPGAWRSISLDRMVGAARRFSRFALFGTPAALLNVAGLQGIALLVAYSYGATVAGWYSLTMRVIALPISFVGAAVGETYMGVAPELARTQPEELRSLFKKTTVRLLAVGIVPTAVLMAAGPPLFALVFGPEWRTSGLYAIYLAPPVLIQLVTSPLSATTNIFERQDLQLVTDALRVALVLLVFGAAELLSWSADTALVALSVALVISYLAYFAVYWSLVRRIGAATEDEDGITPL